MILARNVILIIIKTLFQEATHLTSQSLMMASNKRQSSNYVNINHGLIFFLFCYKVGVGLYSNNVEIYINCGHIYLFLNIKQLV